MEMWVEANGKWNDRVGDLNGYDRPFVCKGRYLTHNLALTDLNTFQASSTSLVLPRSRTLCHDPCTFLSLKYLSSSP